LTPDRPTTGPSHVGGDPAGADAVDEDVVAVQLERLADDIEVGSDRGLPRVVVDDSVVDEHVETAVHCADEFGGGVGRARIGHVDRDDSDVETVVDERRGCEMAGFEVTAGEVRRVARYGELPNTSRPRPRLAPVTRATRATSSVR